jgi:hypothetical protein
LLTILSTSPAVIILLVVGLRKVLGRRLVLSAP